LRANTDIGGQYGFLSWRQIAYTDF
jgi:hypothetical protein